MRRIPDNLPALPSLHHRREEWERTLTNWLKAEEDETEARMWEGWVLDEVNRQRLPKKDFIPCCKNPLPQTYKAQKQGNVMSADQHESEDFAEQCLRYYPEMVEWLAWRFGLRHEQAEDAAKDAIVKAYERRHTYNPTRASLRTLLFRIAENVAIDHHRKHRREIKFSEKDDSEDSSSFEERLIDKTEMSPEQALMETVARENRRRVIDVLSPTSRQIFDLWQDKGYKPKEIADVLGISVKDVNRMQQQLRREFPQCMERLNLSEEDLI